MSAEGIGGSQQPQGVTWVWEGLVASGGLARSSREA